MRSRLSVVLLIIAVAGSGCHQQQVLAPQMEPLLSDVPVPANFRYDAKRSSDFANMEASGQYNNYYYVDRSPFTQTRFVDVVDFYKRYMPVEGWQLKQDEGTAERKQLLFTKGEGTPACRVTIFSRGEHASEIQITRMGQ